jgi:hypothetical protein
MAARGRPVQCGSAQQRRRSQRAEQGRRTVANQTCRQSRSALPAFDSRRLPRGSPTGLRRDAWRQAAHGFRGLPEEPQKPLAALPLRSCRMTHRQQSCCGWFPEARDPAAGARFCRRRDSASDSGGLGRGLIAYPHYPHSPTRCRVRLWLLALILDGYPYLGLNFEGHEMAGGDALKAVRDGVSRTGRSDLRAVPAMARERRRAASPAGT